MPELPEVETIKRGLAEKIIGSKIIEINILNPKSFQGELLPVIGQTITQVRRRAKVLIIDLSNDQSLIFHLKMSGQLILSSSEKNSTQPKVVGGHPTKDMLGQMPNKSTRVIFSLSSDSKSNNYQLYFNDQRKFGWVKVIATDQITETSWLKSLGPEPLESAFTVDILKKQLNRRPKTPVKVALLDQQLIAGIGNIYACEACFMSRIDPKRFVKTLTDSEIKLLHQSIIDALQASIKYGGSSKTNYLNASGEKGYFLDVATVYDRLNQPCRVCQQPISKIKLGGRGTYLCTNCQV